MNHVPVERLFLIVVLACAFIGWSMFLSKPAPIRIATSNIPSPQFMHLPYTQSIIDSSTSVDVGIFADYGDYPAADIDYMQPPCTHQNASAPGSSHFLYHLDSVYYVQGSGWVETFSTPDHHPFSFLHIFQYVSPGWYRGGQFVGLSGWPTSSVFGNGNGTCSNSHLCLVASQGALNFFSVAEAYRPFPATLWNSFRREHHLSLIPYQKHGMLTTDAQLWESRTWLGGILHDHKYFKNGVMKVSFRHGAILYWPAHLGWNPKVVTWKHPAP